MPRKNYAEHTAFSVAECSEVLGIGTTTIRRLIDTGQLKGFRLPDSKKRKVMRHVLVDFAKENGIELDISGHGWNLLVVSTREQVYQHFYTQIGEHVVYVKDVFDAGRMVERHSPEFALVDFAVEDAFQLTHKLKGNKVKVFGLRHTTQRALNLSSCKSTFEFNQYTELAEIAKKLLDKFIQKPR